MTKWKARAKELGISMQPDLDVILMLADDAKVATWNNNALPTDKISLENAAIFSAATRWPLIIDP